MELMSRTLVVERPDHDVGMLRQLPESISVSQFQGKEVAIKVMPKVRGKLTKDK